MSDNRPTHSRGKYCKWCGQERGLLPLNAFDWIFAKSESHGNERPIYGEERDSVYRGCRSQYSNNKKENLS